MTFLRFLICSVLLVVALCSAPDYCGVQDSSSSHIPSSLLESVQCYNDYRSHVSCSWKKQKNSTLQAWIRTDSGSDLCVPFNGLENGTAHCRYETSLFAIAISHIVFFLSNETKSLCSSAQHKFEDLALSLRARPPLNLSSVEDDDGGRRLQWSSPYPRSSSLNQKLIYQLSYRTQADDGWISENVTNTSVKLARRMLLPGRRYEARVRTRASFGHWSEWSPVVTWQTRDDVAQVPPLHCVLDTEKSVTCSWEVRTDLAHLITYQLTCRPNQTAQSERCCVNPTVSPVSGGTAVRFSCSLAVADPEHLQLSLQPAHNAKTFKVYQHIRPDPPQNVTVREKDGGWLVEWTEPATELRLFYQVCYYRKLDQRSPVLLNSLEKSTSVTILDTSLAPLQDYQVKVRSLVVPGHGSQYKGIPSKWTDPQDWTSNEASWSLNRVIYLSIGALAAAVVLILFRTVPACQRKVILWVDSVPSPGKSKILSEIKSNPSLTFMQSEKTFICKVQHHDSISTCSSEALLWPSRDSKTKCMDQNSGCWNHDNLPSPVEKVSNGDTSSMSFSGPYIFCQVPAPVIMSENVQHEEKGQEAPSEIHKPSFLVPAPLYGKDYVCLPTHAVSRSTEDLTSRSENNTNLQEYVSAEQNQYFAGTAAWPTGSGNQSSLADTSVRSQPSDYTSGPFPSWPQEVAVQASGYCHLPPAFINSSPS
ncbi:cytokine receptor common subunit beta [Kryptolebias marmoratus]|uniref:Cytokine receptor common subunit beta-like n=1 Tax=Kryptolebias marmoratus TaxID=37003 RepID=A0A3Q3BCD6_KRYMA|nr:cytokine receptor common subunit beta [Kryptolebias marmoratus]XP_037834807.1 cytokine receptor common subunit beta [Kryptolebias marmoratus]